MLLRTPLHSYSAGVLALTFAMLFFAAFCFSQACVRTWGEHEGN